MKSLVVSISFLVMALASVLTATNARATNFTVASHFDSTVAYVGDSSYMYILVHNTSGAPLTVTASVHGTDASFFYVWPSIRIETDSSLSFYVRFAPDSLRRYNAICVVTDSITSDSVTLLGIGIAPTYVAPVVTLGRVTATVGQTGHTTVYVYNENSYGAVTLDSLRVAGTASITATAVDGVPYDIPASNRESVTLSYTPSAAESLLDTLIAYYTQQGTSSHATALIYATAFDSGACMSIEGDTTFYDSLYADWADMRTIHARNLLGDRVTLLSVTVDDSIHWSVDSVAYGHHINPSQTTGFVVTFRPAGDSSVSVRQTTLRVTFRDDTTLATCTLTATLTGFIKRHAPGHIDTTHLALAADSTQTLHLSSSTRVLYIRLDNNTGGSLIIDTAYLANGTYFTLEKLYPDSAYAFHVPNATYVAYRITLLDTLSVHYDTLYVVTEQGIMAIGFPIVGNSTLADVADPAALNVDVLLTPNPARENVTIQTKGLTYPTFELFDVLGNSIRSSQSIGIGSVPMQNSIADLSPGTYYVRVSGQSESGQAVVVTRRLVIKR